MTHTRTYAFLDVSHQCFNEVTGRLAAADQLAPRRRGRHGGVVMLDGLALRCRTPEGENPPVHHDPDGMKQRIASRLFEQPHDPSGAEQVREIFDQHLLPHLLPDRAPLHPDNARQVRDLLRLLRQCCETGRLDRQTEIDISTVIEHAATWCPGVAVIETPSTRRVEIENP